MSSLHRAGLSITAAAALVSGSLLICPAANAETAPQPTARDSSAAPITQTEFESAVAEARRAGAITAERALEDGARSVTVTDQRGHQIDLVSAPEHSRLWSNSDSYGFYVSFNATDQQLIISGAGVGLTAGMCLLGPAVCAVSTAVVTIATVAMTQNGGIRCGTKALRVYPFSGHKPRCA